MHRQEIQMYMDYHFAEAARMQTHGGYPPEDIAYHRKAYRAWKEKLNAMRKKLDNIIN